jgi:hypothetical protein
MSLNCDIGRERVNNYILASRIRFVQLVLTSDVEVAGAYRHACVRHELTGIHACHGRQDSRHGKPKTGAHAVVIKGIARLYRALPFTVFPVAHQYIVPCNNNK